MEGLTRALCRDATSGLMADWPVVGHIDIGGDAAVGLRTYAGTTGLLGGAAWVVRYFVEQEALWWAGLALLALACATAGAALVSSSAMALRIFVAVAFPALVASVWWVIRDGGVDVHVVDAVFGGVAALAALGTLSTARGMAGKHA